jgi:hypothetical protein
MIKKYKHGIDTMDGPIEWERYPPEPSLGKKSVELKVAFIQFCSG